MASLLRDSASGSRWETCKTHWGTFEDLRHARPGEHTPPRSLEWSPRGKMAAYVVGRLCKLVDKEIHDRLIAECPHPSLERKADLTPGMDTKIATFLARYIRDS